MTITSWEASGGAFEVEEDGSSRLAAATFHSRLLRRPAPHGAGGRPKPVS
jgi:hypothetical protein